LVFDGDYVKLSIVLYRMQFTILLLHEEERRGEGGFGRANVSSFEHILQECI